MKSLIHSKIETVEAWEWISNSGLIIELTKDAPWNPFYELYDYNHELIFFLAF